MSYWLILERLENNDLSLPKFATSGSVGMDFQACLKRQSICVINKPEGQTRHKFICTDAGERTPDGDQPSEKPILIINPHETIMISLGYKCQFNEHVALTIHVRSSTGLSGLSLANEVGIIDSDYRHELFACIRNTSTIPIKIEHGQRIVQGILLPIIRPIITERAVDTNTSRQGGFGSTG